MSTPTPEPEYELDDDITPEAFAAADAASGESRGGEVDVAAIERAVLAEEVDD